ncbi:MAG: adenosylcobalamin-dependent ribonucleoside-diphosphate reductase [Proteobacteria bacterium]|nr:adenosylcobalamin-dependent ribonucleoside-diphosphate reductase [Pseudomonadota bacterium]
MLNIAPISLHIWDMKYRLKGPGGELLDATIEDSWRRVAKTLAAPEDDAAGWQAKFQEALTDFRFLPAGRILAGAGAERSVTLFNCFVMGTIPDDMAGIFTQLKEAALTLQQGGGIGYDFSTLRPRGALVKGVGADASGPLSFMDVWDSMCRTIMSAGHRRGAMMATLRCDHPDIEAFIEAKREPGRLRMFNLSVLVTDAFMRAVEQDDAWQLTFGGVSHGSISARELWDKIMRSTYGFAEPGVIFIDRINRLNNLSYCETIQATNPCGEQPLPPYGACLLGSVNLAALVSAPFEPGAAIDADRLDKVVRVAVRMLDNAIDVSRFPLEAQADEARDKRRIGLGITGLADALIMCGARYGSKPSLALIDDWMHGIQRAAYLASTEIAAEKGAFPLYDADAFLAGESIAGLDDEVRAAIREHGIRNALLTSVAPTGTISLLADNVSSGIEPVFNYTYTRNVLMPDGGHSVEEVSDYAYRLFRRLHGENAPLPDAFVNIETLSPIDHLRIQAAVQRRIDSSISKTINCAEGISFEDFKDIYAKAYAMGCKGCTTYRPNPVTGAVLQAAPQEIDADDEAARQSELPLEEQPARPEDHFEAGGVVYMTKPLGRPEELPGATYKLRWPESEHAMYITINDILQDGRVRPFEMFINSKNMEHYAWTVALTRMISAVFRRGGDISFVVDELKAIFDPRGGQWVDKRYVPSIIAAIGNVIERHLIDIGFMPGADAKSPAALALRKAGGEDRPAAPGESRLPACPKCALPSLIHQEGCDFCTSCGYSKCA